MVYPSYQGRELWEKLRSHQDGITAARDEIFNECQRIIEELTQKNQDLTENFEGQKAMNREIKKELEAHSGRALELEMALGRYESEKSLIVCLIDGDGAVFHEDLLTRGLEGGREAARLLSQGIIKDLDATPGPKPRDIKTMIFINMPGLGATLERNDICASKKFTEFVQGFNQATPLFTVIDVGHGKDAADAKLRDNLLLYARLVETRQVFFCGAHDGGYGPTLKSLETEGHLHKVTVMEGSVHTAIEYKRFFDQSSLRVMSIPGLFTQKKLVSAAPNGTNSSAVSKAAPAVVSNQWTVVGPPGLSRQGGSARDLDDSLPTTDQVPTMTGSSSKSWVSVASSGSTGTQAPALPSKSKVQPSAMRLDLTKPYTLQEPRLCNFYYLYKDGCYHGDACKHSHKYELTESQLQKYAEQVKGLPCWNLVLHDFCQLSENCFMGHFCPAGPKCAKQKAGICKWKGEEMHDPRPASE